MADPIVEQIAAAIATRLAGITTGAGYNQTVSVIRPSAALNDSPQHNQVWLSQGERQQLEGFSAAGNPPALGWQQEFNLLLVSMPGEKRASDGQPDTTPIDTYCNRLEGDVVKHCSTPTNWHTWSGLAINSQWGAPEDIPFNADAGLIRRLPLFVQYRVDEIDPYTQR